MKIFRSPCCIQIPSRPVSCTRGWVQLIAEKRNIDSFASLVVHGCAIKNVIVASQLYDVVYVQFTVEKQGPLELLQFIKKYNLGNSVPNIVIMLRISSQLPIVLLPVTLWEEFFETKADQELLNEYLAVDKSCHTVHRATIDRWNKFWHCRWKICQQKGKNSYCVENCSFHFRNKDGLNFLHFLLCFPLCHFCFSFNCYIQCLGFRCVFKAYHKWACESTVIL